MSWIAGILAAIATAFQIALKSVRDGLEAGLGGDMWQKIFNPIVEGLTLFGGAFS
jgi:hypothetical protein